jgi:hypothetical protein
MNSIPSNQVQPTCSTKTLNKKIQLLGKHDDNRIELFSYLHGNHSICPLQLEFAFDWTL